MTHPSPSATPLLEVGSIIPRCVTVVVIVESGSPTSSLVKVVVVGLKMPRRRTSEISIVIVPAARIPVERDVHCIPLIVLVRLLTVIRREEASWGPGRAAIHLSERTRFDVNSSYTNNKHVVGVDS